MKQRRKAESGKAGKRKQFSIQARSTLQSAPRRAFYGHMKSCFVTFLAAVMAMTVNLAAPGGEMPMQISVLDSSVLCVRASHMPDDVTAQIQAAAVPGHLAGTVLDLRFAEGAATNAADYFAGRKSPLVILVNAQTRGGAATLASQLRESASAMLIGNTNSPAELVPDLVVAVGLEDEKKYQENPFFNTAAALTPPPPSAGNTNSNLLAYIDHTSEADLVRKRIKDGEQDGELSTPRAEPPGPVIRDPALARAVDLLKALAALHPARG
jgi:hypothetical protein